MCDSIQSDRAFCTSTETKSYDVSVGNSGKWDFGLIERGKRLRCESLAAALI
jgi:hypothetical protein